MEFLSFNSSGLQIRRQNFGTMAILTVYGEALLFVVALDEKTSKAGWWPHWFRTGVISIKDQDMHLLFFL